MPPRLLNTRGFVRGAATYSFWVTVDPHFRSPSGHPPEICFGGPSRNSFVDLELPSPQARLYLHNVEFNTLGGS